MSDLIKSGELAKYLRKNPVTIIRWIKEGKVRATKVGKTWYINKEDLGELLQGLPDPRWDI